MDPNSQLPTNNQDNPEPTVWMPTPEANNVPQTPNAQQTPPAPSFASPAVVEPSVATTVPTEVAPTMVEPGIAASNVATPAVNLAAPQVDPAQPLVMSTDAGGPTTAPINTSNSFGKKSKKRPILIALAVLLVLLLGGGYVFAIYLPNTPNGVYARSLNYSNRAYDKFVAYENDQAQKAYKGADTTGKFNVSGGGIAGDGTFSSKSSGGNSTGTLSLDAVGQKFGANFRSLQPAGQASPDLYFQVTGIKSLFDGYGLKQYDALDGQWIAVDHTLIDGAASAASGDTTTNITGKAMTPTQAEFQDALKRIGVVDRQYLFTTDKSKAVLVKQAYLGKSTEDGRSVYGYKMGYDKANLKSYSAAVAAALDASSLNAWVKQADGGKSFSQVIDTGSLNKSIDSAKADYSFNMYVDAKTKTIHQFHFADSPNPVKGFFNLGLNYTGTKAVPFVFEFNTNDSGQTTDVKLVATINTDTNKLDFDLNVNASSVGSPIKATATMEVTPSNDTVNVTAPAGAVPIMTVLNSTGLSSLLVFGATGQTGTSGPTPTTNLFTLTQ
jgi:hypothetical protein